MRSNRAEVQIKLKVLASNWGLIVKELCAGATEAIRHSANKKPETGRTKRHYKELLKIRPGFTGTVETK